MLPAKSPGCPLHYLYFMLFITLQHRRRGIFKYSPLPSEILQFLFRLQSMTYKILEQALTKTKHDFVDIKTDRYMCSIKEVKEKYRKVHLNLSLHTEFRPNH